MSAPLCVIGDFAWDVLIRTNSDLLTGGDPEARVRAFVDQLSRFEPPRV